MNAISRFGLLGLFVAAAAIPATVFAGPAPYENAVSKAMHPGRPHVTRVAPRYYVQPRTYVQPRVSMQPRVVARAAPAAQERRVFSYEPAQPAAAAVQRRAYSYEPAAPAYVAPFQGRAVKRTYENATMKGLGQIR